MNQAGSDLDLFRNEKEIYTLTDVVMAHIRWQTVTESHLI